MVNAKTVPQNKILHRLLVDSGVHPRVLHDVMDVGRCATWLTEFASVLEVPLISWPMSRLHARIPRSSPATHNLRLPPFSFSTIFTSCFPFLADSTPRHLRSSSSTLCTSRVRRTKLSSCSSFCRLASLRETFTSSITWSYFQPSMRKKAFRASILLRGHCDAYVWWLSWTMNCAIVETMTD